MVDPLEGQLFLFRAGTVQAVALDEALPVEPEPPAPDPDADLPQGTGGVLPPPQRLNGPARPAKFEKPFEPETAPLFPVLREKPARTRIEMSFSRRMSDLVRRLQLLERDAKKPLELTLPQVHALHALRRAGSLRMQELALQLGLAQSTVTRLVAPLKRMGLLDRRPDRTDGRATRAFLTDEGTAIADAVEGIDRDLYQSVLDELPETRRAEVVAAVELLHEVVLSRAIAEGDE